MPDQVPEGLAPAVDLGQQVQLVVQLLQQLQGVPVESLGQALAQINAARQLVSALEKLPADLPGQLAELAAGLPPAQPEPQPGPQPVGGRPTKLNPQTQDQILAAVELGATLQLAAEAAGISYETLNNWRKRGEAEADRLEANPRARPRARELPYLQFFQALKRARAKSAVGWLQKIEEAANGGTWTAAAWKLERLRPQDYGRRVMELQGQDGQPLGAAVAAVTAEDLARARQKAAEWEAQQFGIEPQGAEK